MTTPDWILIVTDHAPVARQLSRILTIDGRSAQVHSPHSALSGAWTTSAVPDAVLLDATVEVDVARDIVARVTEAGLRPPAVLSFSHDDHEQLLSHVDAGHDHLLPPFLPALVLSRLTRCLEHRDLSQVMASERNAAQQRQMERELQIGREIQRGFLPETLPVIDGWDIAAYFAPAREVSGDFYDAYDVINGSFLGFAIADVCDKGIGAALFMALIRSLLRQAASADDATVAGATLALRAVRTTNDYLTTNHLHQAYFATLFFGVIDPTNGELVYINCGHNPPIVRRAGGELERLGPTGPALGLIHDANFELGHATIAPGDLLFLYTDGVSEAKNAGGEFFGDDRVRATLAAPGTATAVVERFTAAVTEHVGAAEQFDDVTMLGLHRAAPGEFG